MIFAKSSTRTRVSFEVGAYQLGGRALFLSSKDIQIGRGEPISDTARVLSRYVDGIMIRTFDHAEVEELARFATIPVINGLTDLTHPCQVLADVFTIKSTLVGGMGSALLGLVMGITWPTLGSRPPRCSASSCALRAPKASSPTTRSSKPPRKRLRHGDRGPRRSGRGAHVVKSDVWASMGQEGEAEARRNAFKGYTVDSDLMRLADPKAIFLHCLPAHRGEK